MDSLISVLVEFIKAYPWGCISRHMAYIRHLEQKLETLKWKREDLIIYRNEIRFQVENAEREPRMSRSEEVEVWLTNVERLLEEINVVTEEGRQQLQNRCLGSCFPKNLRSTYKIGKKVAKKLESVTALIMRLPRLRLLMPELPVENTVGLDSTVERVWRCIEDENTRVIRLCGIGGVGKSTLLKKVNNEFHKQNHDFDFVIWVKVSRQEDYIEKVQDAIKIKLDISKGMWSECSSEDEKGALISSVLKSKKFVLLLDDVWERFDLLRLGIHLQSDQWNRSKVIFTTRSVELQNYMSAQKTIEVECLPPEQALKLFRMIVGENILNNDPELSKLAEIIATSCGGLPLALLTVGRAMASRRNPREWRHAVELLQSNPSEIEGEGFLDGPIPNPRDQAEFIVGTLKLAYLLESDESKQCVRMHDIVHDMALWLARDQGKNKNKVLVTKTGTVTYQELTKWEGANWISLWGSRSRVNIDYSPSCNYLTSLLFRDTQLKSFPSGFFGSMPALKVLDLSGNQGLVEIPSDIGKAKTLQYLNLSCTNLAELPAGLMNLTKLRCLLLDYTENLKRILKEVISSLLLLQVYSKISGVLEYFDTVGVPADDEVAFLEALECSDHINKIGITIFAAPSVDKILKSCRLRSCIMKLKIMDCDDLISLCLTQELGNLEMLEIYRCCSLREFKLSEWCKLGNLRQVYIAVCPLLLNLNFLAFAKNLETLTILDCESLEEVSSEEIAFPGLKTISLTRLRNLKSICPSPRCFPSLSEIEVSGCSLLMQLPFDMESSKLLQKIRGETEWWNGLIWNDASVKYACRSKFVSTISGPSWKKKDQASTSR
ncbi:hypothetical protein REPUB_Repub14bG0041400 [Reevesia pubescens]